MKTYIKNILTALMLCFAISSCQDNENWRIIPYEPEPEVPSSGPAELRIAGGHQGWKPEAEVIGKLYPVKNDAGEMDGDYAGYVYLGTEFKICPNASWDGAFGASENTSEGSMETGDGLGNLKVATEGYYYVTCNIKDLTWKADPLNFGVVGDATGSWDIDNPLTYDAADLKLKITMDLVDGKIKFRANGAWGVPNGEFGGGDEEGKLFPKGADIPVTVGKYQIIVDLSTTDYTYKLIAQ